MSRLVRNSFYFGILAIVLGILGCAADAQQMGNSERILFNSLNRERAAHKLPELRWDAALAKAAHQHAALMAQRNDLSHRLRGEGDVKQRASSAGARFDVIAENIAEGPDAATLHSMWMKSPHHRANILDKDVTAVGIAVVPGSKWLFAVQDFSRAVEDLSLREQEKQIASLLHARGLQINSTNDDARKTCAMNDGYAGRPSTMFRFEGGDLSELPDPVKAKIKAGKYHSASVGACKPESANSFAHYRIAVLLF